MIVNNPTVSYSSDLPGTGITNASIGGPFGLHPTHCFLYNDAAGNGMRFHPYGSSNPAFVCPSDGESATVSGQRTKTNYRMCYGDVNGLETPPSAPRTGNDSRGAFVLDRLRGIDFAGIADGLSNTIFFSERLVGTDGTRDYTRGMANYRFANPNDCRTYAKGPGREFLSTTSVYAVAHGCGGRIGDSFPVYAIFQTILPPNDPTCGTREDPGSSINTATSNHSGGVNVLLGDGSVRFISETINCGNLSGTHEFPPAEGGTHYGVWGALGTRAAGESVALP